MANQPDTSAEEALHQLVLSICTLQGEFNITAVTPADAIMTAIRSYAEQVALNSAKVIDDFLPAPSEMLTQPNPKPPKSGELESDAIEEILLDFKLELQAPGEPAQQLSIALAAIRKEQADLVERVCLEVIGEEAATHHRRLMLNPDNQEQEGYLLEQIEDSMMRIAIGMQGGKVLPSDVHQKALDVMESAKRYAYQIRTALCKELLEEDHRAAEQNHSTPVNENGKGKSTSVNVAAPSECESDAEYVQVEPDNQERDTHDLETKLRQDLGLLEWQIRDLMPFIEARQKTAVEIAKLKALPDLAWCTVSKPRSLGHPNEAMEKRHNMPDTEEEV